MFSFETFKDKRYWMLLPPFIIILVLLYIFTHGNLTTFMILSLINIAIFWTTYHLWKFLSNKENKDNTNNGRNL